MKKIKKPKPVILHLAVTPELKSALDGLAQKHGCSLNYLVVGKLIPLGLRAHEEVEKVVQGSQIVIPGSSVKYK